MTSFEPRDPDFERRVRADYARQGLMQMLGAELVSVAPGTVTIELPFRTDLTQQHGFLHGSITTAIADTACGFAAMSLMPPGVGVLTVEYKVNFLAPARGVLFVANGQVVKPGRSITVCTGEVLARSEDGSERLVAVILTTMTAVPSGE